MLEASLITICQDVWTKASSWAVNGSAVDGLALNDSLSCSCSLISMVWASAWSMLGILDELAVEGMEQMSESDLESLSDRLVDCDEVLRSRGVLRP